jgi:hypothetical protein
VSNDLEAKWRAAISRHAESVGGFVAAAEAIEAGGWREPASEGKWSPAEIAQHLLQTYETLVRQIEGGEGLRIRTNGALRFVLRHTVLRRIMRTRRIPRGARAPRELAPREVEATREAALDRLREAAARFEQALLARSGDPKLALTHHIFGSFPAIEGIDFVAIHTEHHARQLEALAQRGTPQPRAASAS